MNQPLARHTHHPSARLLHHLNWAPCLFLIFHLVYFLHSVLSSTVIKSVYTISLPPWCGPCRLIGCQHTAGQRRAFGGSPACKGPSLFLPWPVIWPWKDHLLLVGLWAGMQSLWNLLNAHMGPCIVVISVNLCCISLVGRGLACNRFATSL